jgi:hypothetical protein
MISNLDELFQYHPPKGTQPERYDRIRKAAKYLAGVIMECTPSCPDQTIAIQKVREAVMMANAAIAIHDKTGYLRGRGETSSYGGTGMVVCRGETSYSGETGMYGAVTGSHGVTGLEKDINEKGETGLIRSKKEKYKSVSEYCESRNIIKTEK